MPDRPLFDRLNDMIDVVLSGDDEIRRMSCLAETLRDLPRPAFRDALKTNLLRKANMSSSSVNPFREGFHTITPYVMVHQIEDLLSFLKGAFGAKEKERSFGGGGGIHTEVQLGDSMLMIGGGGTWRGEQKPAAFHYYVPDAGEVYERALQHGATSLQSMVEEHGEHVGSVRDAFGNEWYISTRTEGRYVPDVLRDVTVYLHPKGAPGLIRFLKDAFAAEEIESHQTPDGVVQHAKVRIGNSTIELGEAHGQWQPMPVAIYLYVLDVDAVYRQAVAAGARSLSEPADQPYGDRNAGVEDAFGNTWYIASPLAP